MRWVRLALHMMPLSKIKDVGCKISREVDEFSMATGHFWRLLGSHKDIKQVDVYDSPVVQAAYEDKRSEFERAKKPTTETWVFHGTHETWNIEKICESGFKVGGQNVQIAHGAAYGRGVYTAEGPRTPMSYGNQKAVILCKALPGDCSKGQGNGDSWVPQLGSDWRIFKTAEQLLPVYVLYIG